MGRTLPSARWSATRRLGTPVSPMGTSATTPPRQPRYPFQRNLARLLDPHPRHLPPVLVQRELDPLAGRVALEAELGVHRAVEEGRVGLGVDRQLPLPGRLDEERVALARDGQ